LTSGYEGLICQTMTRVGKFIVVWLFVGLLLAIACLLFMAPAEPRYLGRPLRDWARNLTLFNWPPGLKLYAELERRQRQDAEARLAIQQLGTNAVPALLRYFLRQDPAWRQAMIDRVNRQKFVRVHLRTAAEAEAQGELGLLVLGPAANGALPALARAIDDSRRGLTAIRIMAAVGSAATPYFTNALFTQTNRAVRLALIDGLGGRGPTAPIAIPALLRCAREPDAAIREAAVCTLSTASRDETLLVPVGLDALEDIDAAVRFAGCGALGVCGTRASAAADALLRHITTESDPDVRANCAACLFAIAPEAAAAAGFPREEFNPNFRGRYQRIWPSVTAGFWQAVQRIKNVP